MCLYVANIEPIFLTSKLFLIIFTFMNLTEEETLEINVLIQQYPVLKRFSEELHAIYGDPVKSYLLSQKKALEKISEIINTQQDAFKITADKDDKALERIDKLSKLGFVIAKEIRKFEIDINQEERPKGKKKGSILDNAADEARNNR